MDSRLLNAFHDDQFDGNYVKYDTDAQFWSNDSGTLGLQLAETLHGILPIAPTEVIPNNLFTNSILKEGDYSLESKNGLNTNSKMYGNYQDVSPIEILNNRQVSSQQTIEIMAVDPNGDYDSDFLQSTDDDNNEEEDEEIKEFERTRGTLAFDDVRSYSRSTFRSRTDSSSIGDYESHSSDYDDDSDEMDLETVPSRLSPILSTKPVENCTLNSDGNDLKKSIDDVDPFAMQLDVNTFDLAAFITQDDQVFYNHSIPQATNAAHRNTMQETVKLTIPSDTDSDVIVDVETIENEEMGVESWNQGKENEIELFDNVKDDPSWSPNKQKVDKKEAEPIAPNFEKKFTIVPSKRQSNFFKRKFGIGRGKNINMHRNPLQATPKSEAKNKSKQSTNINSKTNNVEEKIKNSNLQTKLNVPMENKAENIIKKQDLKPVKIKIEKPNHGELVDETKILDHNKCTNFINEPLNIKLEPREDSEVTFKKRVKDLVVTSQTTEKLPKKRKLNLEEYKKRRETPSLLSSLSKTPNIQHTKKNTEASKQTAMPVVTKPPNKFQISKPPQSESVTSIVKSLKENQSSVRFTDPITEAKNKVLRLQELKKAQQIKIIDSTVSSKVARVTKLLPLKDIVQGSYKICDGDTSGINNSEYEEIIIVSRGCNTDITIPPNGYSSVQQDTSTNSSRSLLKSNVLLANISNSFQKVRSNESVKISTNSLIVSIQDIVVKKGSPKLLQPTQQQASSSDHGEDKIIMHLHRDRIRKRNVSQSTQTDLLPEFSVLPLPRVQSSDQPLNSFESRRTKVRRKYRAREKSYSSEEEACYNRSQRNSTSSRSMSKQTRRYRSSISSSYSESEDYSKRHHRYSGSSSHSRGCSISSTEHRSRSKSFDRIYHRHSRSRSKSSSRSRSKRRDASRPVERNISAPAVEERRIVYVGRIEQDTTKEMLQRKFIAYGPIKQITIHYKDTGMKYGFVTYEKSEDAFRVIDSGQKDVLINMYDISFGGRRAFCRASYADLDNTGVNSYQSYVVPRPMAPPKEEDSFEALLLKVKAKLNATKPSGSNLKT